MGPCQSIGHSSGDENYNFTIACQAMPGDFCYNRQLIFHNCQVMFLQLPGNEETEELVPVDEMVLQDKNIS